LCGHFPPDIGPGEPVTSATALLPPLLPTSHCNCVEMCAGNSGSKNVLARDMRGGVRVRARICARVRLLPLLPTSIHQSYHEVNGSKSSSRAVALATGLRAPSLAPLSHGNPPLLPNKIEGGYAARRADRLNQGLNRGAIGENFPAWRAPAASIELAQLLDQGVCRNGGFLRVSACRSGRVGTGMLERCSESRRKQPFPPRRRQLCRLTEGARGPNAERQGGRPPFGEPPASRMLADAIFPIWIRPVRLAALPGCENAPNWKIQTGSGATHEALAAMNFRKSREIRQWTSRKQGRGHLGSVDPRRGGAGTGKLWGAFSHVN